MEILKYIGKIKLIVFMINIFYIAPIIWLTHLIYTAHYGEYSINEISIKSIIDSLYHYNTWFTIFIFCTILILSMFLESIFFPFLVMKTSRKTKTEKELRLKEFIKYMNKYLFGFETSEIESDIYLNKRGFISNCYKIPTALLFYSFCFYHHILIMTLLFAVSIILIITFYKGLKSYLDEK